MRKLLALALLLLLVACDAFGRSKVARGELYQSGDARWDPYFAAVHEQQVAAGAWPDDKKAARKPLVAALDVAPSASDDTLVSATRDRVAKKGSAEASLASAVEETKRAELDRAARLKAAIVRLDDLTKQGKAYEEETKREYENRGALKADDKKSDKMQEIRRELDGAVGVCSSLSRDAKKNVTDAQDFVDDLTAAVGGREAPKHRDHDSDKKDETRTEEKKEEKKEEPKEPPKPVPPKPEPPKSKPKQPPPPPVEKPKPPPAEKPKAPDEVFNP